MILLYVLIIIGAILLLGYVGFTYKLEGLLAIGVLLAFILGAVVYQEGIDYANYEVCLTNTTEHSIYWTESEEILVFNCIGAPEQDACAAYNETQCLEAQAYDPFSCMWVDIPEDCFGDIQDPSCNAFNQTQCNWFNAAGLNCTWNPGLVRCDNTLPNCADTLLSPWPAQKCQEEAPFGCFYQPPEQYCTGIPPPCEEIQYWWSGDTLEKCLGTPGCIWDELLLSQNRTYDLITIDYAYGECEKASSTEPQSGLNWAFILVFLGLVLFGTMIAILLERKAEKKKKGGVPLTINQVH